MCGRYGRWSDPEWLIEEFSDLQLPAIPFPPTYNAAPQSQQPVLRLNPHTGQPELVPMRWGLIPFWASPGDFNRLTFNARAEELSQKPTFRDALKSRRCLVPVDAFYEWKRLEKQKQPYAIVLSTQRPFAFAGLWDRWRGKDGTTIESFTIATTAASEWMATLHTRMPCILSPSDYRTWLEPGDPAHSPVDLLRPAAAQNMRCWPVEQRVGNVRNDDPQLVKPIAPAPAPAPAMNLSLFSE
jgi:putative SOS response-associated peptidase YedK